VDNQILDEGLKIFAAMEDERMECCIHCGNKWYSMHYRDGVCHSCQKKNLPGRNVMQERQERRGLLAVIVTFLLIGGIIVYMWMH